MKNRGQNEYIGVRKRKWGRWVSEIREPGTKARIWLGSFDTPQMAAAAYDSAAYYFKGSNARLNFPHLATTLPMPTTNNPDNIRHAAHQAAMQFSTTQQQQMTATASNLPTRVALSPTHIQAIKESPLDLSEMWMEAAATYDNMEYEVDTD